MRVVVVGAGLGGLSAACHLTGACHEVTVVERTFAPGGRAGRWSEAGFHIDTGPSVLTMRDVIEDTIRAAGQAPEDLLSLVPLDPMYRATFAGADGPEGDGVIYVRRGREAMQEEIRSVSGSSDARSFGQFCDWLSRLYRVEVGSFIGRSFDHPLDLLRPPGPLVDLVRLGALRRLSAVVGARFKDPRLRRLFSFQALYAGLSPLDALAVYSVITYMDTVEGVWAPRGGMHALPQALALAVERAGGSILYGAGVARLLRRPGARGPVRGVELEDGQVLEADAVVANAEVPAVYRVLLDGLEPPRPVRRGEYSPSAALWLAGVRAAPPPGAAHHNLHFGVAWEAAFHQLLRERRPMRDPSILVSLPATSEPGLAPAASQVVYALEPVPNLDGPVDWATERDRARARLVAHVRRLGYLGDGSAEVVVERFADPLDWRRQGMERGTPFSLSHRFFQSGPFRPSNVDPRVPGLVLVGSGTVPGVGVPMVLVSGRLAAARVAASAGGAGMSGRPGRPGGRPSLAPGRSAAAAPPPTGGDLPSTRRGAGPPGGRR